MTYEIIHALTLALVLNAAAFAGPQSRDASQVAPRMRLTGLRGELRVEAPCRPEAIAHQELPYISPGTVVRVVLGRVEFKSDYHVIVTAGKGAAFRFTAFAPTGSKPGTVKVAAVGESEGSSLNVIVGNKKFFVPRDAAVIVSDANAAEPAVHMEGGTLEAPAAQVSQDSSINAALDNVPRDLSSLAIAEKGDGVFELWMRHPGENPQVSMEERVIEAIAPWPAVSQRVAEIITNKYGLPDQIATNELVWNDNGPWKTTVVYRKGLRRGFFRDPADVLRQSIDYDVPRRKAMELSKTGLGVGVEHRYGRIYAISDSEETNMLAINLAIDVINDVKTADEARESYAKTMELSVEGKTCADTQVIRRSGRKRQG